jgi:ABC-type branched-subunit amino acid transport system substrate-binding protein
MGSQGIPAMGVVTSGPELSSTYYYKMYARTSPSEVLGMTAIVAFSKSQGWRRVAIIHAKDAFGTSYAEVSVLPIPVTQNHVVFGTKYERRV